MAKTFETTTCGRCGGSGSYSWNAMHGDRCYGCGGTGRKYTKAGKAAYDAWFAIARPTLPLADLKIGMKLRVRGFSANHVVEIESIEPDPRNEGHTTIKFVDGGGLSSYGAVDGSTFLLAKTAESHRAAWDAVYGMAGVVEKEEGA